MNAMSPLKVLKKDLVETFYKLIDIEKNSYRYWRVRILYASIICYSVFYIVRNGYSMAIPALSAEFGYSKTELGVIATYFSISYGIGRFVSGYLSDRSNARYFIALGLLASALANVCMGLSHSLVFLSIFWFMNGWAQSMGWPAIARMLTHWFSPKEIGTKWGLISTSHQIGAGVTAFAGGYIITYGGWQWVFFVATGVAVLCAFFGFNRLRDTPKEVGLPAVEEYKQDVKTVDEKLHERITLREVFPVVLKNKNVWFVGLANLCLYIPRMGVAFWAPTFLMEHKGFTLVQAGTLILCFEMAGLLGGIAAGWMSDTFFGGRRGPVGAVFLLASAFFFFLLWWTPGGYFYLEALLMVLTGFLLYGPQVLVGIAAADFASKRAVGVATGVTGSLANLGAAMSGFGIGWLRDYSEQWDLIYLLFIGTALLGAFFFALTWNKRAKVLEENQEFEEPLEGPLSTNLGDNR